MTQIFSNKNKALLFYKMSWDRIVFITNWVFAVYLFLISTTIFAFSPYSTRELDELEQEFIQLINQSNQVIRHPLAMGYINHLGKRLANHSHQPLPDFFIVQSNEINAFAGPGGHIGINSQLILATDDESELAAVMAHEMAHVRQHHLYRMLEHQKQMRIPMVASVLASIALGVLNPAIGSGALMASLTGVMQDSINFTRANEKEADRIGIDMLIKSGLNPKGMAGFFKKMQLHSRYYYMDHIPPILRTHPLDDDRIAEAENRAMHLRDQTYLDSIEYGYFKELIRVSSSDDKKRVLDFYHNECRKQNPAMACAYGQALAYNSINRFSKSEKILLEQVSRAEDDLYLNAALADSEIGNHKFQQAQDRIERLYRNYPDNYAVIMTYGHTLIQAKHPEKAAAILLKGMRIFKRNLPLCQLLAQSQADKHEKNYAYFTQAHCELLQGRPKKAITQLKLADKLTKKDHLLKERIKAKIEEINFYTH